MNPITTQDLLSIPGILALIVLLAQLFKAYLPDKWEPLCAVVLGIVVALGASVLAGQTSAQQLTDAVLRGLVAALAAVGTFQLQKPLAILQTKAQQKVVKADATAAPHG